MSSNETVADIVREMRNDAIAADAWHETYGEMASAASTLNRHADRIEKAHNREIAAKDAEIAELKAAYDKLVKELADALDNRIDCRCGCDRCSMPSCTNKANRALVAKARKALEGAIDESK